MPLRLLRRAVRRILAPAAPTHPHAADISAPPPLLPSLPAAHAAALAAFGAMPLAVAATRHAPGHATLALASAPEAACLAIAVTATVAGAPASLHAALPDGTVLDAVTLAPAAASQSAWLFVPPATELSVHLGTSPEASLDAAAAWVLPPSALAPAALVPAPPLAPDPAWSRAYGTVPPHDAAAGLRAHAFARLSAPAKVPVLDALALWLEPGDELSRAVMISGLYEPDTLLAISALLPPGGTFVDVGAHCGLVALYAAQRAGPTGRVLAFEPSPREFARLQANLAANPVPHASATRAAVADQEGIVTLRLAEPGHAGHNTIGAAFAYEGVATAALEQVPATTLDIALAALPRCDLIKMDIEGAELRALHGAQATLARLRPALILEVFDQALAGCDATEAALFAWLDREGYDTREIDPATVTFGTPAHPRPGLSRNVVALPRTAG